MSRYLPALLLLPLTLHAGSIYLNGVKIDRVKNQRFKNVDVEIDSEGNIYITGKDYEVFEETVSPYKKGVKRVVTRSYYLVSEENFPGSAGYSIEVYINNNKVKTIISGDAQTVLDITRYIVPGDNTVKLRALKDPSARPGSKDHFLNIYIGDATREGNNILIQNPQINYRRTAAETENLDETFTLKAE